jgi:hypothetical protein
MPEMMIMRKGHKLRKGLNKLWQKYGGGHLIELGGYAGESTAIHAKYFDSVLGIDPWERGVPDAKERPDHAKNHTVETLWQAHAAALCVAEAHSNIVLLCAFDHQIAPFIGEVDGVYIDAWHHYPEISRQIRLWLPHCRRFIAGHDYANCFPGVKRAVEENFGKRFEVFADTSWAVRLGREG